MTSSSPTEAAMATASVGLLGRLRRVTSGKAFIPEVDGLRFLAIASVVLMHLGTAVIDSLPNTWPLPPEQDWARLLTASGGLGVNIFFAISGFVLALPFGRHYLLGEKPVRLSAYYWRRLTRLEPPYIIIMLALFAAQVWLLKSASFSELLPHLGASLLYLHCLIYGEWSTINPVAWSLETEVQFYLLAPVFAQLYRIRAVYLRRLTIVGLILLIVGLGEGAATQLAALHLDRSILVYGHLFLVGFLYADIHLSGSAKSQGPPWHWDLAGIAAILGLFYLPHNGVFSLLFTGLLLLLFYSVFRSNVLRRFFCQDWVTATGGMCYTIYLIHYAFLVFVLLGSRRLALGGFFWQDYLLQALVTLPLLFIASVVYFLLVEKPCMYPDWPQRLGRRLRREPAAA